jgi:hypothetical protein
MARRPLPGVFAPMKVTVAEGATSETLVIRGMPHVVVEARIIDSKGNKARGSEVDIVGKIDGDFWVSSGQPNEEGMYVFHAPHGLENAHLNLMTSEHTVLRHRLSRQAPLRNTHSIPIGTLDQDISGIEIIRYVAPIVVVKIGTKAGPPPVGATVSARYTTEKQGQRAARFEQQEDGRFRSLELCPDQEVTLTAQAKGYAAKSATLTLAEGATREIELILDKNP